MFSLNSFPILFLFYSYTLTNPYKLFSVNDINVMEILRALVFLIISEWINRRQTQKR